MIKHARSHGYCQKKETGNSGDGPGEPEHDAGATEDWVYCHVLEDLEPISSGQRGGARRWRQKRVPGNRIGGRKVIRRVVKKWHSKAADKVKAMVQRAKEEGCRFTLGVDGWKNKGRRRRQYLVTFAWWVDRDFRRHRICLDAREMVARRQAVKGSSRTRPVIDHQAYVETLRPVLAEHDLHPSNDVTAHIADHDVTQRKALKQMGFVLLGCACHGLQLPPRHVLPPLRAKKTILEEQLGSSSDSSESSDSSSNNEEAESLPQPRDPERAELTAALEPLFKKSRSIAKGYINHENHYNELEGVASSKNTPFRAYKTETATRWSSQESSMASVLFNTNAQAEHARISHGVPACMTTPECQQAAQVCGVLTPHLVGARTIEHDSVLTGGASSYLPVWRGVMHQLGPEGGIPKPEDCGEWGRQDGGPSYYQEEELTELTRRLRAWLADDTGATYAKFNAGHESDRLLRVASLLDPRYKALSFLTTEERERRPRRM